ncbi:V-type ATP synthase subunit D [Candidatus Bathyarchaeota archaeon]|nr:V-type ATP synthase subunit D [Candidatus Bathyarchaeota archaeon]
MSAERLEVHPTRLELLRLRKRKTLAEGIADILQKDLETLILALIEKRKEANSFRNKIFENLNSAYSLFKEAEMINGPLKTRELSLSRPPIQFKVDQETTSGVLGIQLPHFELVSEVEDTPKARFNLIDTPYQLIDASWNVERAAKPILGLAELTAAIREILEIISLKRRQVNRIRFKIIPQIDSAIRYVELILEEIERQDAIRVRVLQRKRKERTEKTD